MIQIKETIIKNYLEAYNTFDTDRMTKDMSEDFTFENIQSGETNMILNGIEAFKTQALEAKAYFSERKQTLKNISYTDKKADIEIDYFAIVAVDFPNGLKKGDHLTLSGKSIFEFNDKNQITHLTDIS